MIELNDNELQVFKASLNSGYGFTKSCHYLLRDVEEMAEYARTEPGFMDFCEEAVKAHTQRMIMMGMKHLTELDFDKFLKQNGFMTRLVGKLTLWGEYCAKEDLKNDIEGKKLLKAVFLYKYPEEVATACSMTLSELYDHIQENGVINNYLSQIGFV